MLNTIKMMAVVLGIIAFASCTKTENNYITVENVTVSLDAQKLVTKVKEGFKLKASTSPTASQEYEHTFATSFKAYFVSLEQKGEYQQGQVVKVIDVTEGANTITVPALKYKVVVSNYAFTNVNNLLNQNRSQLPEKSSVLYLYGDNNIDYSTQTEGEVSVTNDYAALQVFKNEVTPTKGNDFFDTPHWYVVYVRNQNGGNTIGTNIQIPVKRIDGSTGNYNSSQSFPTLEANKIHKIIFTHDAGNGNGGNLFVKVQEDILKEVEKKTVTIN